MVNIVVSKKLMIGSIVGIVAVAILIIIVIAPNTVNEAVPHERSATVASGTYSVPAGSIQSISFTVPPGASNARLKLHFTAKGGSGNDIIVKVESSRGGVIYNSRKISSSYTTITLPYPGTYRIILDNTFSVISSKQVTVQATLTYVK